MIKMQVEKCMDCKDEVGPLLDAHYQELTLHKDVVKLNVDWELYDNLEKAGLVFCITAREDGKLIGYALFFVKQHIHYKDLKVASNDVLFLDKAHRKGMTGVKLIKKSEQELNKIGVQKIVWHAKQSNYLGELLMVMGYGVEDILFGKILGD
jgi:GNAT superfamily N-acetyltransferase